MAIDKDKAFEVENGFLISDAGVEGPLYTGGSSSPDGLDLPVQTFYVQNTASGCTIWHKFGVGVNDWEIFPASKISFDPTGYQNFQPTDINADLALQRFGNYTVTDLTQREAFSSPGAESTTSDGWVVKLSATTANQKTAGMFEIRYASLVSMSQKAKNAGVLVEWKPNASPTWITIADLENGISTNGGRESRSGGDVVDLLADDFIDVRLSYGQTVDGGTLTISNVGLTVIRISD